MTEQEIDAIRRKRDRLDARLEGYRLAMEPLEMKGVVGFDEVDNLAVNELERLTCLYDEFAKSVGAVKRVLRGAMAARS